MSVFQEALESNLATEGRRGISLPSAIINIHDATTLSPSRLPGKMLNFGTLWGRTPKDLRTYDGHVLRLKARRPSGSWVTSRDAITPFVAALTPATEAGHMSAVMAHTPALRFYDRRAAAMFRHELTAIDARRCRKVVKYV